MLQISTVPTVTRMVSGWVMTQATVIVVDVWDIKNASRNKDGACPPPAPPQGERGNQPNHRGRGKELTDLNKNALLNYYRLRTSPFQLCVHQEHSSLLRSDSNCNYVEKPHTHTHHRGQDKDLNGFNDTK